MVEKRRGSAGIFGAGVWQQYGEFLDYQKRREEELKLGKNIDEDFYELLELILDEKPRGWQIRNALKLAEESTKSREKKFTLFIKKPKIEELTFEIALKIMDILEREEMNYDFDKFEKELKERIEPLISAKEEMSEEDIEELKKLNEELEYFSRERKARELEKIV